MKNIDERIKLKQATFSKGLQKIANHYYRNPYLFAMNSAREAGKQVGVSETTIIRFANELGYSGYSAFQSEVQEQIYSKSSLSVLIDSKEIDEDKEQPIKNLMMQDMEVISQTIDQINESDLSKIVNQLIEADKIMTVGAQSSYSFASWFAFSLDLIRGNTHMYQSSMDNPLLRIGELSHESVLIAFSFHRYAAHTIEIAKLAKQNGVKVVAFTDSPIAPIVTHADIVLPIQLPVKSTIDIAPTIFMVLSGIISIISLKDRETFRHRTKHFDSIESHLLFSKDFSKGNE